MNVASSSPRSVGSLALLLFVLGLSPALLPHGWLHGGDEHGHDAARPECLVCRLDAAPATAEAEVQPPVQAVVAAVENLSGVQHRAACPTDPCVGPPSRAPPPA
jgi:hypothetical protein